MNHGQTRSRRVRPFEPPKRSSMRVRLNRHQLFRCASDGLIRLAAWLGVLPTRGASETEPSYRHRVVGAIQRWEKMYERGAL